MSLEFKPGYYEWTLWNNDEALYTWGDFIDDLPEEVDEEAACNQADVMVFGARKDYDEQEWDGKVNEGLKKLIEDNSLFVAATETIATAIMNYYGTTGTCNVGGVYS